jgi:hypothetical protein
MKTLTPVSKGAWIFFGPSKVSMGTVYNNLENISGWCIRGVCRDPFGILSS